MTLPSSYTLSEVPRDWVARWFWVICRGPFWFRKWMLIQPFRWILFRKVRHDIKKKRKTRRR